jgi:predicted secreted Zn-dependent protease
MLGKDISYFALPYWETDRMLSPEGKVDFDQLLQFLRKVTAERHKLLSRN